MSADAVREIENLLIDFVYAADEDTVEDVVALFASDATWEMPSVAWTGRDAIAHGLSNFRSRGSSGPESGNRHLLSNIRIVLTGDNEADARSVFQLVGKTDASVTVIAMGTYSDHLAREGNRWLIKRRIIGK